MDNNDVYSNSVGSNQGGVDGIPGTLIPLDSIEEYSAETQSGVESGGYSGTTVNLSIKSGTNSIHGSAYYFNRNEFFAALGPFTKASNAANQAAGKYVPKKPPIHFQEYGGSIGGPILRDRMFYFLNYERQQYVLGQGSSSQTEPSTAYVNQALALLATGGVTPATNLFHHHDGEPDHNALATEHVDRRGDAPATGRLRPARRSMATATTSWGSLTRH